jgi:hypothetical protein
MLEVVAVTVTKAAASAENWDGSMLAATGGVTEAGATTNRSGNMGEVASLFPDWPFTSTEAERGSSHCPGWVSGDDRLATFTVTEYDLRFPDGLEADDVVEIELTGMLPVGPTCTLGVLMSPTNPDSVMLVVELEPRWAHHGTSGMAPAENCTTRCG